MSLAAPSRLDASNGKAARSRAGLGTRLLVLGAVAVVGALGAAAVLLWARHGATVFFDILSAGIAACL